MKIGIIGSGAIGTYVANILKEKELGPEIILTRLVPGEVIDAGGITCVETVNDLPEDISLMVDCAGHAALVEHGCAILERGIQLITVSLGALADPALSEALKHAAQKGGSQLHLASGAIGALDCLAAAKVGGLKDVTYIGRKPPCGWRGSPAENVLDLDALDEVAIHFEGSARDAATTYPKNANVAAAVAIAGAGFENTKVKLMADPSISSNIHEVQASGDFGKFYFRIEGLPLPDNPRSSALAAMSVISAIERETAPITF
ncbi:aspartate dehydrogenase [Terasakiella pusilla]|uniref:aspartate dehydrogenase n=1 Tax=Terasakiella pusilla TaxID=64973 RepID=UPI003AA92F8A